MQSYYDRSHSFNKNTIIVMVFFTYKYINVEKALENYINFTNKYQQTFYSFFFSGAEETFKLELFLTEYGELLMFL